MMQQDSYISSLWLEKTAHPVSLKLGIGNSSLTLFYRKKVRKESSQSSFIKDTQQQGQQTRQSMYEWDQ